MSYPIVYSQSDFSDHKISEMKNFSTCVSSVAIVEKDKIDDQNYIHTLHIVRNDNSWMNTGNVTYRYRKINFNTFADDYGFLRNSDSRLNNLHNTFPIALRAILSNGSYIFERPPFRYNLRFIPKPAAKIKPDKDKPHVFDVWIPWTVYHFVPIASSLGYYKMFVYFSPDKLTSFDQIILMAPLPNVFSTSEICYGYNTQQLHAQAATFSLKDAFTLYLNQLYSGDWNSDVIPSIEYIPSMFNYEHCVDFIRQNDEAFAIYTKARNSIKKVYNFKGQSSYCNNYLNSLNMWSQMSLDEVLYSFRYQILDGSVNKSKSFSYCSTTLSNIKEGYSFIKNNKLIDYAHHKNVSSNFSDYYDYYNNPLTNLPDPVQDSHSQEYYYTMLEHIIQQRSIETDKNTIISMV